MKDTLMKWPLIGAAATAAAVAGAAAVAAAGALPTPAAPTLHNVKTASYTANCPTGLPGAADTAALSWVDVHAGGTGPAGVVKTEADVEKGVCVFDVRTMAPNGTIWVVQVRRSAVAASEVVLSANLAEGSPAAIPATSPAPSVAPTPEANNTPQPAETPQPEESAKATETPQAPESPQPDATPKPSQSPGGSDN